MKTYRRTLCRWAAFTLMEIILVVAIIGILVSLVGPRLVGRTKTAKIGATNMQISNIKTALGMFEMNHDRFPTQSEGLEALVSRPSGVPEADWEKGLDEVPVDAWREPFIYTERSGHDMDYDILSKGPDRQEGTDDDITNWKKGDGGND